MAMFNNQRVSVLVLTAYYVYAVDLSLSLSVCLFHPSFPNIQTCRSWIGWRHQVYWISRCVVLWKVVSWTWTPKTTSNNQTYPEHQEIYGCFMSFPNLPWRIPRNAWNWGFPIPHGADTSGHWKTAKNPNHWWWKLTGNSDWPTSLYILQWWINFKYITWNSSVLKKFTLNILPICEKSDSRHEK